MERISRAVQEAFRFFAALVRPAAKSLRENRGLAVLSVVLAFGLWIFVTNAENPTSTRVLPVDIPVQPVNVPQDVAVDGEPAPVRVRLTVTDDVFDSLAPADFEATVDLGGLTIGSYQLPVAVRPLTSRGGLRVDAILPAKVDVKLAQLVSKSISVSIDVQGEPPSGYTIGPAAPDEQTVLVSGPQAQVDRVSQANGIIDVSGRTDNVDQAVRLVARDNGGVLVKGVTLQPSLTNVRIEVKQQKFSRPVVVDPQISGEPEAGYNIVGVAVNPATVTIHGDESLIQSATSIQTRLVDVSGAKEDVVRSVSLVLPKGAEITGGAPVVTVTVKIAAAPGVITFGVLVGATGLGEGFSIVGSLPTVQVALAGPLPQLLALTPSDITATIDLGGRGPGAQKVPVKVTTPSGTTARSVSPADVDITLEKR